MKIRFLKSDSLYILKKTIPQNINYYDNENPSWIDKVALTMSNFIEFKTEINDFDLIISENPEKDDLANIKILYSNLKNLTDSQAGDERLWAGLCHDKFWTYMIKRWPISKAKDPVKYIKKNYFFAHGKNRSLMTNGLAKLWWIGRMTYDEKNKNNPFELTEYLAQDLNGKGFPLFGSNFSNNRKILFAFLRTLKNYEETVRPLSRELFLEMIKYINMLGGKLLIDSLSEDEIKQKLLKRLELILNIN